MSTALAAATSCICSSIALYVYEQVPCVAAKRQWRQQKACTSKLARGGALATKFCPFWRQLQLTVPTLSNIPQILYPCYMFSPRSALTPVMFKCICQLASLILVPTLLIPCNTMSHKPILPLIVKRHSLCAFHFQLFTCVSSACKPVFCVNPLDVSLLLHLWRRLCCPHAHVLSALQVS